MVDKLRRRESDNGEAEIVHFIRLIKRYKMMAALFIGITTGLGTYQGQKYLYPDEPTIILSDQSKTTFSKIAADIETVKKHVTDSDKHITPEKREQLLKFYNEFEALRERYERDDPIPRKELQEKLNALLQRSETNYKLLERIEKRLP